ncbi:hypothetical protein IE81DRAFT_364629 [Ceraceosorus guamensis]|uniref:Uncharacterized protein n=1 Tax=Ceraceosorus guamensis TaxID=1522189 RepID=A0A316W4R5_9BASI|nr:hypothetical protein IE81DRAFT_364629 [Ceraceosorus guamensis]PWN44947.1 hypothetical protein IE81DRAFT_364629 [Ceraceosorus guamensis]
MFCFSKTALLFGLATLAASAPIPVKREVGVLQCDTVWTGTLTFESSSSSSSSSKGNAGFVGVKDGQGLPVLVTKNANAALTPVEPQRFDFQRCTSNRTPGFMGYADTDQVVYGHLSPVNEEEKCVTRTAERFVSDGCSLSDDSSQLLQYFKLNVQSGKLSFVGVEKSAEPSRRNTKYGIQISSKKHGKVAPRKNQPDQVTLKLSK